MTDAKELVERARYLCGKMNSDCQWDQTVHEELSKCADWIERWAPVEAAARRARQASIACASDKSAAAELRARQTNDAFFAAITAALGEDKP